MAGSIAVLELHAILLEGADVELLVMEISEQLLAVARERAAVEMIPNRYTYMSELHVVEMVVGHRLQVFVETVEGHGVERRYHRMHNQVGFVPGDGMVIVSVFQVFREHLHGNHHHGSVNHHQRTRPS